jgi:hypothetical protein
VRLYGADVSVMDDNLVLSKSPVNP